MICVEVHSNNVLSVRNNSFENTVSDSVKHETVKFLFTDNWKDYQKTAVFTADGVEPINVLLVSENEMCISQDECYIPFEVLKGDKFGLSVFGVLNDRRATSTKVIIDLLESGYALGDAPSEPTPDEYSAIIGIMNDTKQIAQSVRDDADNGVFNGKDGVSGVGVAVENGGEIFNDYKNNKADGLYSHSEGNKTSASGNVSHASGFKTTARYYNQFVCGRLNDNKNGTLFEVGNGDDMEEIYSNAFEVYSDGHAEVQKMGDSDNSVVTKKALEEALADIEIPEGETPSLDGYVKNTDYATKDVGGVVKVNGANGISMYKGVLILERANESEIIAKQKERSPITPRYLDLAVKVGLTTNTIQLTAEEKRAVQDWLGITELLGGN